MTQGITMPGKHSHMTEQGRATWYTERLWELSRTLPIQDVSIGSIAAFDQDCWFGPDTPPTCRAVALHAQRIQNADLSYPIILSASGNLMDGGHRLAKAWLLGHECIRAVQFVTDPEPDYIVAAEPFPDHKGGAANEPENVQRGNT